MKKILACILVMLLMLGILPVYAASLSITEQKTLIQGVTYTHMERLMENGWQDIYVVQADLKESHLKFRVLNNQEGKSYLQNTYEMAKEADAIAAINADFFSAKKGESGRGSAIGIEMTNGILHTSPAAYESMNALYMPKDEEALYFNQFTYDFKVTAPSGASDNIIVINKYDDLRGIVMYTPDWGKTTPGSGNDVMEVIVEDGIVIDKRWDHGPAEIPENGYVLSSNLTINNFLDTELNIGDAVTIDITTLPNFNNLETAVGGGGMVLVEGNVPKAFSHTISGLQPRSAVGLDKEGKVITLATVDGRRTDAKGITMTQLGYLMAELGCYNAMNLDGGGSTLMALKDENDHIVANKPSDNYTRPVTNSIGIVLSEPYQPILSGIKLQADDENVFLHTGRKLTVKAFDQYNQIMSNAITGKINWSVLEGSANIVDNILYPKKAGIIKVEAEYMGHHDVVTIHALDTIGRLSVAESRVQLAAGNKKAITLTGYDEAGKHACIYASDVSLNSANPAVATFENGQIKAVASGSCVLTASLDGITANMVVTVGDSEPVSLPKNIAKPDPAQQATTPAEGDLVFTVFGNTRTPKVWFDVYLVNGAVNAVAKDSSMNFFVGNDVNPSLLKALGNNLKTAHAYSVQKQGDNTFITLNNGYGKTLFGQDATQFQKFCDEINNLKGGNLFVFLNDHNISSSSIEVKMFKKLMKEAAQKCSSVYVFAGGYVNETVIEDGVRYITTAGIFPSIGLKPPATNLSYIKYYVVTIGQNGVTYEMKDILKR